LEELEDEMNRCEQCLPRRCGVPSPRHDGATRIVTKDKVTIQSRRDIEIKALPNKGQQESALRIGGNLCLSVEAEMIFCLGPTSERLVPFEYFLASATLLHPTLHTNAITSESILMDVAILSPPWN
jgi:hypothetical protein